MSEASKQRQMEAVRWEGKPFSVSVRKLPIPRIAHPEDAIIRVTSSAVCGTDLHFFRGRLDMDPIITGHESMGIVEEIGSAVSGIKVGDRVVVNSDYEQPEDNGNDIDLGFPGIVNLGDRPTFQGGHAEYQRVPWAVHNLIVVPPGKDHELDYLLLADIFPTAWYILESAEQVVGDTVAVFGAGPVGLLTAYSAILRGASKVYVVDRIPERLQKAKSIGAIPINFAETDPVEEILKREPNGVDRSCECCGYECEDTNGKNVENVTLRWCVTVTRPFGGIGVGGVYLPPTIDPKDPDGFLNFPIGEWWTKSISMKGGIVDTRRYQNVLQVLIESGKAKPSFVFDKRFRLKDAKKAFKMFAKREIIKPYFTVDGGDDTDSSSSDSSSDDDHHRHGSKTANGKRPRTASPPSLSNQHKIRKAYRNGQANGRRHYHS